MTDPAPDKIRVNVNITNRATTRHHFTAGWHLRQWFVVAPLTLGMSLVFYYPWKLLFGRSKSTTRFH